MFPKENLQINIILIVIIWITIFLKLFWIFYFPENTTLCVKFVFLNFQLNFNKGNLKS